MLHRGRALPRPREGLQGVIGKKGQIPLFRRGPFSTGGSFDGNLARTASIPRYRIARRLGYSRWHAGVECPAESAPALPVGA